ncbi:hypothetical protein, partial [Levilactobacillus acidifarinae]
MTILYNGSKFDRMIRNKGTTATAYYETNRIYWLTRKQFQLVETLTVATYGLQATVTPDNKYIYISGLTALQRLTLGTGAPYGVVNILDYGSQSPMLPAIDSQGNIVFPKENYLYKFTSSGTQIAVKGVTNSSHLNVETFIPSQNQFVVTDSGSEIRLINDDLSVAKDVALGSTIYNVVYSDNVLALPTNDHLVLLNSRTLATVTSIDTGGQNTAVGVAVVKNHYFVFGSSNVQIYELNGTVLAKVRTISLRPDDNQGVWGDGRFVYFVVAGADSSRSCYKVDYNGNTVSINSLGVNKVTAIVSATDTDVYTFVNGSDTNGYKWIQHYR